MKHLACVEIDLNSLPFDNPKVLSVFFNSLRHLKKIPKIRLFWSQYSISLADRMVLTLCRSLVRIRTFPQAEIMLAISITTGYLCQSLLKLLEIFVEHECLTCLHLVSSMRIELGAMKDIFSIFQNSLSLSEISLTFDEYTFYGYELQRIFQHLKEHKSVKSLKLYLKRGLSFHFPRLNYVALALKESIKVKNLQIIFETGRINRESKLQWWLFVRSLKKCANFQKVQMKYNGPLKTISQRELTIIFSIIGFVLVQAFIIIFCSLSS